MPLVFLLDLDNTLIDNDVARDRLAEATVRVLGEELSRAYWDDYEAVRADLGYVDTLATLERFHQHHPDAGGGALDRAILDFPYAEVRYPATLEVLKALSLAGVPVVLSDGDPIFQPLKVARSGVADAVNGNVLVFAHKDAHLRDVARLFPAERYVAVDDKAGVLARVKMHWGERVTTVHVLQGKYADDPYEGPPPDLVIQRIGDLPSYVGTAPGAPVFEHGGATTRRVT
ncbi:MAG TPA: haloacid dehalogenase-like hydrolase [Candidatus Limnocylindria bacterium]